MSLRNDQVLHDYLTLEPGDSDHWDPVLMDGELAYRLALLDHLAVALRHCTIPRADLRVLDLGCGNGRSTRAYLDLGLYPEQLTGVDLREGTIARAKRLHSGIDFRTTLPREMWNWISVSTVFSSVFGSEERRALVMAMLSRLASDGYVFYFDLVAANEFAGGDRIRPELLFRQVPPTFRNVSSIWSRRFSKEDYRNRFPGRLGETPAHGLRRLVRAARRVGTRLVPTHECFLFVRGG